MTAHDRGSGSAQPTARDLAGLQHADSWLQAVASGRARPAAFIEPPAADRHQAPLAGIRLQSPIGAVSRQHRRWRRVAGATILILSLSAGLTQLSILVKEQPTATLHARHHSPAPHRAP